MDAMTALEALRDNLKAIPGVVTCKIGLERGIMPDDYPLIRIVPTSVKDGPGIDHRDIPLLIYFGMPVDETDAGPDGDGRTGLEKVYAALFALEEQIRTMVDTHGGTCGDTITDEDRLETFKLMAIHATVDTL